MGYEEDDTEWMTVTNYPGKRYPNKGQIRYNKELEPETEQGV